MEDNDPGHGAERAEVVLGAVRPGGFVGSGVVWPTAVQNDALVHDTADKDAPKFALGFGLGTSDQFVPFQDSIRVWLVWPEDPTAVHDEALVHDTPLRAFDSLEGFGLETIDQRAPFHDSMRVRFVVLSPPTAVHDESDVHVTEFRTLSWPAEVSGLGMTGHDCGFG